MLTVPAQKLTSTDRVASVVDGSLSCRCVCIQHSDAAKIIILRFLDLIVTQQDYAIVAGTELLLQDISVMYIANTKSVRHGLWMAERTFQTYLAYIVETQGTRYGMPCLNQPPWLTMYGAVTDVS